MQSVSIGEHLCAQVGILHFHNGTHHDWNHQAKRPIFQQPVVLSALRVYPSPWTHHNLSEDCQPVFKVYGDDSLTECAFVRSAIAAAGRPARDEVKKKLDSESDSGPPSENSSRNGGTHGPWRPAPELLDDVASAACFHLRIRSSLSKIHVVLACLCCEQLQSHRGGIKEHNKLQLVSLQFRLFTPRQRNECAVAQPLWYGHGQP